MSDTRPMAFAPDPPSYGKVTVIFEGEDGTDILTFPKATMPTVNTNYEQIDLLGHYVVQHDILNVEISFKPLRQEPGGIYVTEEHIPKE